MKIPNSLRRFGAAAALALSTALAPSAAQAAVVYSGLLNLAIPNNSIGLYVNVITGSTYAGPDTFPTLGGPGANWDFNIFGSSFFAFTIPFTGGQSLPTVPDTSKGVVGSAGIVANLPSGTLIDNSSSFLISSFPNASEISTGNEAIFGFRFRNEGADLSTANDDTVHFGWARVILTGGQPGTLVDYGYESRPLTGILAGAGSNVVPEPASLALVCMGLAGLLASTRRRKS